MLKYIKSGIVILGVMLLLIAGCSDRGTNVPATSDTPAWVVYPNFSHVFVPQVSIGTFNPSQLILQIKNPYNQLYMSAYIPHYDYVPYSDEYKGKPMPVLVLLAPQDGDRNFYFDHGLAELASDMITKGIIRPMIIVTIGNDHVFGGYFYGNSTPAGHMDDVLGSVLVNSLLDTLRFCAPWADASGDRNMHGIGGIGMGAYGAFRAVLKHPGIYGTITTNDGPLDFDGADDNSGLISLIPQVYQEQGLTAATIRNDFDTMPEWPISRMFVGGSLAFSPQDTQILCNIAVTVDPYVGPIRNHTILHRYSTYYSGASDSSTAFLMRNFVSGADSALQQAANVRWGFYFPFDTTGAIHTTTWNRWLDNNLENLISQPGGSAAINDDSLHIWIGTTPQAENGFYDQTASWITTLQDNNTDLTVKTYTGTPNDPATKHQYVYDLIREMLIFHSNNFGK